MARERRDVPLRVWAKKERALIAKQAQPPPPPHDCFEHAVYVETDGALGQAWYCGLDGKLLQVG